MAAVARTPTGQYSPAAGGRVGTTPGPSLRRAVHGSVSAYCTVHAHCPVTVVTPQPGR
jgi:hypothetical protein